MVVVHLNYIQIGRKNTRKLQWHKNFWSWWGRNLTSCGKYFNYLTVHCAPYIIIQWMMLREVVQNKVQKIKETCHVSVFRRIQKLISLSSPNRTNSLNDGLSNLMHTVYHITISRIYKYFTCTLDNIRHVYIFSF